MSFLVGSSPLIGIGPDQVPNNSLLGALAYQNTDNVTVQNLTVTSNLTANISNISFDNVSFEKVSTVNSTTVTAGVTHLRTAGYYTAGDGGGALYRRLASAPAGTVGAGTPYITSNSGTVYWELVVLEKVINVLQLGAFNNANWSAASTTASAINRAIQYLPSSDASYGGGIIFLPAGSYSISNTTLNINKSFITLQGAGSQSTRLVFANMANTDWVRITTDPVHNSSRRQVIRDLMLESGGNNRAIYNSGAAASGGLQPGEVKGASLKIMAPVGSAGIYDVKVERTAIENTLCGIDVGDITNNISLRDIIIIPNQANSLFGINWHCPNDGTYRSDVLYLNNVLIDGQYGSNTSIGIQMRGFVQTLVGEAIRILRVNKGMSITNPTNTQYTPDFVNVTDFQPEGCKTRSLEITHGREFKFVNFDIFNQSGGNGQGSTDDDCVLISGTDSSRPVRNVIFTNGAIGQCRNAGMRISGARDVVISDVIFRSCSQLGTGSHPAISVGSSANGVVIQGVVAEDEDTKRVSYGVDIASGAQRTFVDNLDASRAVTGAVNDNASYGQTFISNIIGPNKNDSILRVPTNTIDFGANDANNTILNIGRGATGNKFAIIDFIGDATYTDYGLRVGRKNDGASGTSTLEHRGAGALVLNAFDSGGTVQFASNNTVRLILKNSGTLRFEPLASPPSSGNASGDVYFDSTMQKLRVYTTSGWANTN